MLGNSTTQPGGILNKNVFLFDTKTYTWTTNFQVNPSASTSVSSESTSTTSSSQPIIIAVSIVGSLVVLISVIAIVFFTLRYRKNNQKDKNQDYRDPNNPNFQNGPNYPNNPNFQHGPNYQNYQNYQEDYQNNQNIIEIPSSTDRNELRYSHHY